MPTEDIKTQSLLEINKRVFHTFEGCIQKFENIVDSLSDEVAEKKR